MKLTKAAIATIELKPGQSERVVWDSELPGFGYRIRGGRRTWVIRPPRAGGKSSLFTIAAADVVDIAEARKAARERLAKAALGEDPGLARREQRTQPVITLGNALARYQKHQERHARHSTLANLKTHINTHWKPLHERPLGDLRRVDVAARLHEIVQESGPQAAVRARRCLSSAYAWAIAEGIVDANPVVGTKAPAHEVRRDRVLSAAELAAVWRTLANNDFGRIIKLLILTGQRRDEVAAMRWSELNLEEGTWLLPPIRMKNKQKHEVPLPDPALEILRAIPSRVGRDLVFGTGSGGFAGFSKCKAALDRQVSLLPWRIHDLRRSTATGMADIGVLPHVIEAVLSHVSGHKAGVAGIYNRAVYRTEKRDALERWAAEVSRIVAAGDPEPTP
ncbi:tyrosine-type recombinase/integrase [Methylobacterium segetis]|uniref:tyrosine-type recombinase/integrase n=1 Tax=Methylobacterium segetis TaxID=2488750 RepID=UPI001404A3C3|nr:site-specific integrase [Methylobacterium segetis]